MGINAREVVIYEIEAWQSSGDLGFYYSKLEVSAFIGIETALAGLFWLDHYFQGKSKLSLQKASNKQKC